MRIFLEVVLVAIAAFASGGALYASFRRLTGRTHVWYLLALFAWIPVWICTRVLWFATGHSGPLGYPWWFWLLLAIAGVVTISALVPRVPYFRQLLVVQVIGAVLVVIAFLLVNYAGTHNHTPRAAPYVTMLAICAAVLVAALVVWRLLGGAVWLAGAAVAAFLVGALTIGLWSFNAARHAQTVVAGPTVTTTAPAPAPTVTAPAPTITVTSTPPPPPTKTKTVRRTVTPAPVVSTVVVRAPAVNPQPAATTSHTRPKPKPTPTHSKSTPKPSPTKAEPKPAKPTIVNVTTLASVNVHDTPDEYDSSKEFCAVGNLPGHDEGVMTLTSKYGSFTEGVFTGSKIGGGCTTYVAPSIVPPGGTDTVTVTLRDMNTGQLAVPNVQTIKIKDSVHP